MAFVQLTIDLYKIRVTYGICSTEANRSTTLASRVLKRNDRVDVHIACNRLQSVSTRSPQSTKYYTETERACTVRKWKVKVTRSAQTYGVPSI